LHSGTDNGTMDRLRSNRLKLSPGMAVAIEEGVDEQLNRRLEHDTARNDDGGGYVRKAPSPGSS